MADIATERAWMRRHAEQQAVENAERTYQRGERERQEILAHCQFCLHPRHHAYIVGADLYYDLDRIVYDCVTSDDWELAMRVDACSDPVCPCGAPPCPGCGDRVRPNAGEDHWDRCPMCRYETPVAAYA